MKSRATGGWVALAVGLCSGQGCSGDTARKNLPSEGESTAPTDVAPSPGSSLPGAMSPAPSSGEPNEPGMPSNGNPAQVRPGTNPSATTGEPSTGSNGSQTENPPPLPRTSCEAAADGGSSDVAAPVLSRTLFDRWHEAWLASPAVADVDADGINEIIVPRGDLVLVWNPDGQVVHRLEVGGRVWAPPVIADLRRDVPGLEIVAAAREHIFAWDSSGRLLSGFPFEWRDELRAVAVADIDPGDDPEIVVVTTSDLDVGNQTDILLAVRSDGSVAPGFPPNTTGAAGCDDACYVHAGFDQTLALGDVDGDGVIDVLAPQDNAYVSLHSGNGRAFDAANIFDDRTKFSGIRFMIDYAEAQQGWAEDERRASQAHFTNTAPAIADVFEDGTNLIVMLSSVQSVDQDDRERGVALWLVRPDGTRPGAWTEPFLAPDFLDGLWDPGDNITAATNQVTVLDLDPSLPGLEFVFAGFDGKIHAVSAAKEQLWEYTFTREAGVFTGGLVAADLSGDGRPELVFNTYSTAAGKGGMFVLGSNGAELHRLPLPDRGAMPVPTIADVEGDGQLEIVVSLKDAVDRERQVLVYTVPGSSSNCLPWPTGRRDLQRTGYVPPQ